MSLFSSAKKRLDFSYINSNDELEKLLRKRELYLIYLTPPLFKGEDLAYNKVYVPFGTQAVKDKYDNKLYKKYKKGRIDSYECNPEYKSGSYVPSKLNIIAKRKGKVVYNKKIKIW